MLARHVKVARSERGRTLAHRLAEAEKSRESAEAKAAEAGAVAVNLRDQLAQLQAQVEAEHTHAQPDVANSVELDQLMTDLQAARKEASELRAQHEVSQDALIAACTAAETAEQQVRGMSSRLASMEVQLAERDAALAAAEEVSPHPDANPYPKPNLESQFNDHHIPHPPLKHSTSTAKPPPHSEPNLSRRAQPQPLLQTLPDDTRVPHLPLILTFTLNREASPIPRTQSLIPKPTLSLT